MLEGRDAHRGHSQQYFSVRDRRFWKIYELQPFIITEFVPLSLRASWSPCRGGRVCGAVSVGEHLSPGLLALDQKECTSSPGGPISATPFGSCACAIVSGLKDSRSNLILPASATRYPVNR